MKTIVVGIMSQEKIRERILAIARGDYKPKATEPKIWFTSMRESNHVRPIAKGTEFRIVA